MNINPQRRGGRRLIASPQAMHAAVMSAFEPGALDGAPGRPLWRLDTDKPAYRLYLVSPLRPDLSHIVEQAGWQGQRWDETPYGPFLDRLRKGQKWGFRLTANPTRRGPAQSGRGVLLPQRSVPHQTQWLIDRSAKWGFHIPEIGDLAPDVSEDSASLESAAGTPDRAVAVTRRDTLRFSRRDASAGRSTTVTILQAQYDGTLEVLDVEALQRTLVEGIGRGKAYGCGLMTLRQME